jgi:hypothetical protein
MVVGQDVILRNASTSCITLPLLAQRPFPGALEVAAEVLTRAFCNCRAGTRGGLWCWSWCWWGSDDDRIYPVIVCDGRLDVANAAKIAYMPEYEGRIHLTPCL